MKRSFDIPFFLFLIVAAVLGVSVATWSTSDHPNKPSPAGHVIVGVHSNGIALETPVLPTTPLYSTRTSASASEQNGDADLEIRRTHLSEEAYASLAETLIDMVQSAHEIEKYHPEIHDKVEQIQGELLIALSLPGITPDGKALNHDFMIADEQILKDVGAILGAVSNEVRPGADGELVITAGATQDADGNLHIDALPFQDNDETAKDREFYAKAARVYADVVAEAKQDVGEKPALKDYADAVENDVDKLSKESPNSPTVVGDLQQLEDDLISLRFAYEHYAQQDVL